MWPVPGRGRGRLPGSGGPGGPPALSGLHLSWGPWRWRRAVSNMHSRGAGTAPGPSMESVGRVQKGTGGQAGGPCTVSSPFPIPEHPRGAVPLQTASQHTHGPRPLPAKPGQGPRSQKRALLGREKPAADGRPGQLEEKALLQAPSSQAGPRPPRTACCPAPARRWAFAHVATGQLQAGLPQEPRGQSSLCLDTKAEICKSCRVPGGPRASPTPAAGPEGLRGGGRTPVLSQLLGQVLSLLTHPPLTRELHFLPSHISHLSVRRKRPCSFLTQPPSCTVPPPTQLCDPDSSSSGVPTTPLKPCSKTPTQPQPPSLSSCPQPLSFLTLGTTAPSRPPLALVKDQRRSLYLVWRARPLPAQPSPAIRCDPLHPPTPHRPPSRDVTQWLPQWLPRASTVGLLAALSPLC